MRSIAVALSVLAGPFAAVAADGPEFRHPRLAVPDAHVPLSAVAAGAGEARAELARLGVPPAAAFYDAGARRWATLLLHEPLIPGTGMDNALSWSELAVTGDPTTADVETAAWTALRAYLGRAAALRVDLSQLATPRVTVHDDGTLVQIHVPRTLHGIPVRDSAVAATISHGNLVLLGLNRWADAPADAPPAVEPAAALRVAAAHAGAGWRASATPRLEYVPFAGEPAAERYGFRLTWVVDGRIAGSVGRWEALVDAGTGALLAFEDRNQYQTTRRIVGGVYPLTNDGQGPEGTEQPGYPMPFADLRFPDGSTVFANSSGVAGCAAPGPGPVPAPLQTRLDGRYVRIADTCGPVLETWPARSRQPYDLGFGPGTDCMVPPGHSAGDTHAARTTFYEVNRIAEQARGYLPTNSWLQAPLVANVNVSLTCGALWNGTALTFYRGGACRNTGELAGAIAHEYGHGVDDNGADPTIANPQEAIADIHSILRHNESCIGRGFLPQGGTCAGYGDSCTTCTGVRDLDWAKHQSGLPHDIGWVQARCPSGTSVCGRLNHCASLVVAEAVWDLHARDLPALLGLDVNSALEIATRLAYLGGGFVGAWYQCTPPAGGCGALGGYMNFLAADDDNGNMLDGTPHATAIHAAFNRHQIACATPAPVNGGCASGPFTAPTLTATPQVQAVALSWTAVPGATRYAVFRADGARGCAIGKAKLVETAALAYLDSGLLTGHQYFYTVLPIGGSFSCFGPMSTCRSATPVGPAACQPAAP
jgi:trimeric autotransporter adhesin